MGVAAGDDDVEKEKQSEEQTKAKEKAKVELAQRLLEGPQFSKKQEGARQREELTAAAKAIIEVDGVLLLTPTEEDQQEQERVLAEIAEAYEEQKKQIVKDAEEARAQRALENPTKE